MNTGPHHYPKSKPELGLNQADKLGFKSYLSHQGSSKEALIAVVDFFED